MLEAMARKINRRARASVLTVLLVALGASVGAMVGGVAGIVLATIALIITGRLDFLMSCLWVVSAIGAVSGGITYFFYTRRVGFFAGLDE